MQISSFSPLLSSSSGILQSRLHQSQHRFLMPQQSFTSANVPVQGFGIKKWWPVLGLFLLSAFNSSAIYKGAVAPSVPVVASSMPIQPTFDAPQGRWSFNLLPNAQAGQSGVSFTEVAQGERYSIRKTGAPVAFIKGDLASEIFNWAEHHHVIPSDTSLKSDIQALIEYQFNKNEAKPFSEQSFLWREGSQHAYKPVHLMGFALKNKALVHPVNQKWITAWRKFQNNYPQIMAEMRVMGGKAPGVKPAVRVNTAETPVSVPSESFVAPTRPDNLHGWAFNLVPNSSKGQNGTSFADVAQGEDNGIRTTSAPSEVMKSDLGAEIFNWAVNHQAIPPDERLRAAMDHLVKNQVASADKTAWRTPRSFIWTRAQDESGDYGFLPAHITLQAIELAHQKILDGPFSDVLQSFKAKYPAVVSEVEKMSMNTSQWWNN